jgi:hypothetical protein
MRPGEEVEVVVYGGAKVIRTLVQITDNKAFICKTDEWFKARAENRKPICVGFPLSDVKKLSA